METPSAGRKKFHEFALFSELFKGRSSWYFCYVKSERIAHTLSYVGQRASGDSYLWEEVLTKATNVTDATLSFCAGTISLAEALSSIFSLISGVRFATLQGLISEENAALIIAECELIAERLGSDTTLLSLSSEQLSVPLFVQEERGVEQKTLTTHSAVPQSDKGHYKGHTASYQSVSKSQEYRSMKILHFIKSRNGVSIKEISNIVRNCSEKTIQRELVSLIHKGIIKKVGERRWSTYVASPSE